MVKRTAHGEERREDESRPTSEALRDKSDAIEIYLDIESGYYVFVGERGFVEDLQKYCEENPKYFEQDGRELYLLRNQSRGSGIGFFEAGNFYPDFILWILHQDKQFVSFIDPKGILNLEHGISNPKIKFHQTVKELQKNLNSTAPEIVLNSFIVSNTFLNAIAWRDSLTKKDFEKNQVFFQKEDRNEYIEKILKMIEI